MSLYIYELLQVLYAFLYYKLIRALWVLLRLRAPTCTMHTLIFISLISRYYEDL